MLFISLIMCFLLTNVHSTSGTVDSSRKSLLFIMFDDLRPELSVYAGGSSPLARTPHIDRLAAMGIVFDHAYCQVSVCAPSRNSLLTGLRPDTLGSYDFEPVDPDRGLLLLPQRLARAGYSTAGYGKLLHREDDSVLRRPNWSVEQVEKGWYRYQAQEIRRMNASVFPDYLTPEEEFRDYVFTSLAIDRLRNFSAAPSQPFMVSLGFKLPHLALHVPGRYFDQHAAPASPPPRQLLFPPSAPAMGFMSSNEKRFKYINQGGRQKWNRSSPLGAAPSQPFPAEAHAQLQRGYAAAVSFLDAQVGRLLDAVDELQLWGSLTVVLTSDHGMHNGEKGIWNKWTLLEHSTRVPLIIVHPQAWHRGYHYRPPVELLDVVPTVLDLLAVSLRPGEQLDGKSLASLFRHRPPAQSLAQAAFARLQQWLRPPPSTPSPQFVHPSLELQMQFALSQKLVCARSRDLHLYSLQLREERDAAAIWALRRLPPPARTRLLPSPWQPCSSAERLQPDVESVMGYSMRTLDFRYILWLRYNSTSCRLQRAPAAASTAAARGKKGDAAKLVLVRHELYAHERRGGALGLDPLAPHMEMENLLARAAGRNDSNAQVAAQARRFLLRFLDQGTRFFRFRCPDSRLQS